MVPHILGAAFTPCLTGVVLSLPNARLVGQFHAGVRGPCDLPAADVVNSKGFAYSVVLHGLQTVWYVGIGLISLLIISSAGKASFGDAVRASNRAAAQDAEPAA